ncbi:MAG: threonine synthase [Cyclobacteriaceae bacterium]|nr:threonine synthase [Cyclobacteriaceae bacterium]
MMYYSTNHHQQVATFQQAVYHSLPPDNGLYFPHSVPSLSHEWVASLPGLTKEEIGVEIARHFVGDEIGDDTLRQIVAETLQFDLPVVHVGDNIHSLELFHGPTWAFKDVGARFLARCLGYFNQKTGRENMILVATSGDTGGAVAAGFHQVPGTRVVVLYPRGKVSNVQKQQLTTWGDNITALEIDGTFDECQALVKQAFLDADLNRKFNLSSANSINIARLIPQSFYYFWAYAQKPSSQWVVSVPSGNYGNLTAGLLAWKMGLPVKRFIAAANSNHIVPDYLATGTYQPKPSQQTYANAMDVGNPSNFVRMLELFGHQHTAMTRLISGFHMDDTRILDTIRACHTATGYLLDPHGAIGYQALREGLQPGEDGLFLETAHPVKFLDVVEKALGFPLDYHDKIEALLQRTPVYASLKSDFEGFKSLLSSY